MVHKGYSRNNLESKLLEIKGLLIKSRLLKYNEELEHKNLIEFINKLETINKPNFNLLKHGDLLKFRTLLRQIKRIMKYNERIALSDRNLSPLNVTVTQEDIIEKNDDMFETAWEYYKNHRDELVNKYCGKYVVISDNKVVAAYDDDDVAYKETIKTIPLGSFLIHHITEEEEVFTISPILDV